MPEEQAEARAASTAEKAASKDHIVTIPNEKEPEPNWVVSNFDQSKLKAAWEQGHFLETRDMRWFIITGQ